MAAIMVSIGILRYANVDPFLRSASGRIQQKRCPDAVVSSNDENNELGAFTVRAGKTQQHETKPIISDFKAKGRLSLRHNTTATKLTEQQKMSEYVCYPKNSRVPWESLPDYQWDMVKNLTSAQAVKKCDHLPYRILLETMFQRLSCGRKRFRKSSLVESCKYAFEVLLSYSYSAHREATNADDAPRLGALALHVATMIEYWPCLPFDHRCGTHYNIRLNQIQRVFDTLSKIHPEAAKVSLSHGRLPLHWALAAGKTWDKEVLSRRYDKCIQVLVEAYPESVSVVDPITGLAPFMLATAVASKDRSDSVNTTYRLLRMDPAMVLGYTTNWIHDIFFAEEVTKPKATKKRKRKKKGW